MSLLALLYTIGMPGGEACYGGGKNDGRTVGRGGGAGRLM